MAGPPRIGFDARWITASGSGVSVYAEQLIDSLLQIDNFFHYVVFFTSASTRDVVFSRMVSSAHARCQAVVVPYTPTDIRSQLLLPGVIEALDLDVFHSPDFLVPFITLLRDGRGWPAVAVTIHDVIPLSIRDACPRSTKSRMRPLYRQALRLAAARSRAVVTVSEASRCEIVRLLGVDKNKVHVVHNGVDGFFRPGDTDMRACPPEILYVGRQDPYKGVVTLVSAFAELRKVHAVKARLVIVGSPDPRYPEAEQAVRELEVGEYVDWLGFLDAGELLAAYRRASVLVLPSHYEGFGLPVLEAMACGTPVVCTPAGGLPEAAGEAADYVVPGDAHELGLALARVLTDEQHAAELVRLGLAQAARFSWDRAAEQTVAVYRQLLEKS